MNDHELNRIVNNDREWRKFMINEIREIRKEQGEFSLVVNTLKIKVAFFSGIIGAVAGLISSKL